VVPAAGQFVLKGVLVGYVLAKHLKKSLKNFLNINALRLSEKIPKDFCSSTALGVLLRGLAWIMRIGCHYAAISLKPPSFLLEAGFLRIAAMVLPRLYRLKKYLSRSRKGKNEAYTHS